MHSRSSNAKPSKVISLVVLPLACVALALAIAFGNGRPAVADDATEDRSQLQVGAGVQPGAGTEGSKEESRAISKRVNLTIDYADGVRKQFHELEWTKDMTVFDAIKLADAHPRGIDLESSGSGSTAFIKRIDDLANGGASPGGKGAWYWQFKVNGAYAKRSAGAIQLEPGDEVVWFFGVYSPSLTEPAPANVDSKGR